MHLEPFLKIKRAVHCHYLSSILLHFILSVTVILERSHMVYSGPSLKGHSREDPPLERTQILGSKYYECM